MLGQEREKERKARKSRLFQEREREREREMPGRLLISEHYPIAAAIKLNHYHKPKTAYQRRIGDERPHNRTMQVDLGALYGIVRPTSSGDASGPITERPDQWHKRLHKRERSSI